MVEDYGGTFLEWMLECNSEIASHGYVHDMNKRYGGNKIYAGQYELKENIEQVRDGVNAIEKLFPGTVSGIRMPYAHFNEYTYNAIEDMGLKWASNTGIDDFINHDNGFDNGPFKIKMGNKTYSTLEIPLDTQTFDWAIWLADKTDNHTFVEAVELFCNKNNLANYERTPSFAAKIWKKRIETSIKNETIFTLLCHPVNLTVKSALWEDPVDEFLLPVIDLLGSLTAEKKIWLCTCAEMTEFYKS
jgi:peptidoglycan/xylan/chitin deacetylase (PgdA/CDA1 family)